MAHFTVPLAILLLTGAVLGAAECQNQANLEGSCEPRLDGRVALQTNKKQLVESIFEEVPDVGSEHWEKNTNKGDSLTQSDLSKVAHTEQWLPFLRRRRTPKPARPSSPFSRIIEQFNSWVIKDIKFFGKEAGKEWQDLPHEVKTKIIEFCPDEDGLKQALGDEWNNFSGHAKQAFRQCQLAGLLQVSKQSEGWVDIAKFLIDWASKIDSVVEMYEKINAEFGKQWDKLPVTVQAAIITFGCSDTTYAKLIAHIKELIGHEVIDDIA
eukprot:CAMPEP_0172676074 /NCGR_PEP_ID=MMETSP1074-20121228/13702_1 /TAXON_ID=2916 /ORGANISM="Ceratium fusus, Strain PA161109" /LENGTH=266 /DNA_ID=CAMNT_0013493641 /DNA_START=43 /DNA_END=839 /DNA_ORIENTATION=-